MPLTTLKPFAAAAARTALLSGMTTLVSAHESSAEEISPTPNGWMPRIGVKLPAPFCVWSKYVVR